IPESQQQAIFESFIQANNDDARKYGGTGLGLTIARSLVELMGGNLNLKSAPGQGATFFFSIPLIEAEQPATTSTTQVLPDTGKVHVLVAEDNEYNFLVTRDTLKKYFPEVAIVHAKNGAEAVDACAEDDYDFVLMDVHMPVMDGYAATKKLRSDGNSVPIIGLTASVVRSDLDLCLQCGMNAFVPKPFTDAEFLSALQPFLPNQVRGVKAGSGDVHAEEARFLTYMPDKLTALQRAIDKRDFQQTKSVVHTIRPQLVAMGLQQEDQWCRQLELSTQPGDTFFRMGESLAENISRTILALRQKHNA
ncbi:MAG: response regulator, partial [Flavobacteriales bacterium]|nr:response regulator [Flavobacteriales bacterium]